MKLNKHDIPNVSNAMTPARPPPPDLANCPDCVELLGELYICKKHEIQLKVWLDHVLRTKIEETTP